jgi:hypothetical protein
VDIPEGLDGLDQWAALSSAPARPRSSPRTEILHNIDEDRARGLFQVRSIYFLKGQSHENNIQLKMNNSCLF